MSARLHTDLRFASAPFEARGAYLLLLGRARELPTVLEVLSPTSALAAVTGTSCRRAATLLAQLRAAGLVSADGLELLVGAPRPRSRRATGGEGAEASGDELRDRLRACGRSLADLARKVDVSRTLLSLYADGKRSLNDQVRSRLAAELGGNAPCNAPCNVTCNGSCNGACNACNAPPALPASPPSLSSPPAPPSDSLSDPTNPLNPPASSAGAREGQGKVEGPTEPKTEQPAPKADEKLAPKRAPKPRPEAPADPVPAPGTAARRVYDAIVGDRVLQPITAGPGDLAERLCAPGAYPGVDVLAAVRAAGTYAAGKPAGSYADGRRYLCNWLGREAERARLSPKPVAPAPARVVGTIDDLVAEGLRRRAEKAAREEAAREEAEREEAERKAREAAQAEARPAAAGGM